MDLVKLSLLLPLLPLFLVPLFLVGAAWADRRRHATRRGAPGALEALSARRPQPSSQPRSRPSDS